MRCATLISKNGLRQSGSEPHLPLNNRFRLRQTGRGSSGSPTQLTPIRNKFRSDSPVRPRPEQLFPICPAEANTCYRAFGKSATLLLGTSSEAHFRHRRSQRNFGSGLGARSASSARPPHLLLTDQVVSPSWQSRQIKDHAKTQDRVIGFCAASV